MVKTTEQGFILAATLWMLAFMAVGVAYFSQDTLSAVENARKQQQNIKTEIAMLNTQATLFYLMMLESVSKAGIKLSDETRVIPENSFNVPITHLPLDERPIRGFENIIFSIQDEGGLVPLNSNNTQILTILLRMLGVSSESVASMITKLLDYKDSDSLSRINGAEKSSYRRLTLPPPLNSELYTSGQAKNILGWAKQKNLWNNNSLLKYTSTVWYGMPNFNTAPRLVLQLMGGVSAVDADKIIEKRQSQPLTRLSSVVTLLGKRLSIDPTNINFFPSKYFRITLWEKNGRQKRILHVELTTFLENDKPWKINAQYHIIDFPSMLKP